MPVESSPVPSLNQSNLLLMYYHLNYLVRNLTVPYYPHWHLGEIFANPWQCWCLTWCPLRRRPHPEPVHALAWRTNVTEGFCTFFPKVKSNLFMRKEEILKTSQKEINGFLNLDCVISLGVSFRYVLGKEFIFFLHERRGVCVVRGSHLALDVGVRISSWEQLVFYLTRAKKCMLVIFHLLPGSGHG